MSDIKNRFKEPHPNNPTHKITSFGLKNFRIFKEYQDFQLKPFTILTGTNNSGKSSVTKALLLIKENEEVINKDNRGVISFNYFTGEHNLGNHRLVKNKKDDKTIFYFTFFENYQFEIDISPTGEVINDYGISINGERVISQSGGKINFNVLKLVEYFKQRVEYIEFDNFQKIESFINLLEYFLQGYHSVDINLYDEHQLSNNDRNIYKDKEDELTFKHEKMRDEGVYAYLFDLYCEELQIEFDYLNDDILDFDWDISLIYLFNKISGVELTKKEINKLIPFKGAGMEYGNNKKMLSFSDIIYIPTIKEQIKRVYSLADGSLINKIIRREIRENIYDFNNNLKYDLEVSKYKKDNSLAKFMNKMNEFAKKWLKEFEIGEKLSYGYNEKTDTFFIQIDDKYLPEYGFGYSQILYIIFALHNEFEKKDKNCTLVFPRTYIIEEPETGLHPSFQSKMADMIVDAQREFDVNFIIETHSEYFIRKFQYLTANNTINTEDTVIYYFNNPKNNEYHEEPVKEIFINKYGGLSDNFGKGFIDEATTLKFDLLRFNKNQHN